MVKKGLLAIDEMDRLTHDRPDTPVQNLSPMLIRIEEGVEALSPYVIGDPPRGQ